ncbi:CaiB/BaiF CoA transferase family protein [Actinocatenispora sera]|uniref:CoA transferase n=1 Tax=Actinocatenispora sera TaxID=390989 RepID=A0A810L9K8_9ACTN|nr:CaiB/BaiF CoA-transferase family protein [Actinocatenispora sera]BCJ30748.1 CoA transferase [Actinocatenispora sera]
MQGPLAGFRIVELAGIGPAPFAGMMLADLGADVVRVDRPGGQPVPLAAGHRVLARNRRSLAVDLKQPDGVAVVHRLVAGADALIEGYRPGVAERLGLGPDECLAANPRLVYGRMTGWGQTGPLAQRAGHDIDFIALAGALGLVGDADAAPTVPLNLIGDFGGGGMLLAVGVLAALLRAGRTGRGQVVDAAMVDGAAVLLSMMLGMRSAGMWGGRRGRNLLDGGAPFYAVYRCADGGYVAVGALEDPFYAALLDGLGLADDETVPDRTDRSAWPQLRERFAAAFAGRTRDEWADRFAGTDACVAPVLDPDEAAAHPHLARRGTYRRDGGMLQPAPAPRFSATPAGTPTPAPAAGAHTDEILAELGYPDAERAALRAAGAIA